MSELAHVLRHLTPTDDPRALVGVETGDDAGVYLIDDGRAIAVTTDFFTPIVDDAYDFGRIGAANALSDLYAMGARPLFALNLVAFPRDQLDSDLLGEIVRGGAAVAREAGIPILGGHSIDDPEPKYGMVAVGEVDPGRMVTNSGARAGDRLILTKPLGTGIVSTAVKAGTAPESVVEAAVRSMATLNKDASDAMMEAGVRGATDVTGYGLLGHLRNLLRQSGVAAVVRSAAAPVIPGARALVAAGHVPGGTRRNLADLEPDVRWDASVDSEVRTLLADAQTSGGLLIAVPEAGAAPLLARLRERSDWPAQIGVVVEGEAGSITVE